MENIRRLTHEWITLLGPNHLVQAFGIIVVFLILAKLSSILLAGILNRIAKRTTTDFDDRFIAIMHRPVFVTVAIVGMTLATYRLDISPVIQSVTLSILKTILIMTWLVFGLRVSRLLLEIFSRSKTRFTLIQPSTAPLLNNLMFVIVLIAGAYSIMVAWDINVTGLVASAGIVGLALSFAAQDTLSNLFAGVAILADRPYKIGDYINLNTGERGEVTHIGLRSTRILTRDDVEVAIPNGVMGSAMIVNETAGPSEKYRIRVAVGVAYGSDIDLVMATLQAEAESHQSICDQPAPRVRFRRFGDSSLDFELLCWIEKPEYRGLLTHELNCGIYKAFNKAGISIPFPQRDLHIKEIPTGVGPLQPTD